MKKNDLDEQFIKLEWKHKGVMSIHLVYEGFKSSCWLNSSAVIDFFSEK